VSKTGAIEHQPIRPETPPIMNQIPDTLVHNPRSSAKRVFRSMAFPRTERAHTANGQATIRGSL